MSLFALAGQIDLTFCDYDSPSFSSFPSVKIYRFRLHLVAARQAVVKICRCG